MATLWDLRQIAVAGAEGDHMNTRDNQHGEAATQSYSRGSLVTLSSGKVAIYADTAGTLVGAASLAASGVTDTDAPFVDIRQFTYLIANLYYDSTGLSNANNALAVTDLQTQYGLVKVGDNWYVDKSDTGATVRCIVIQPDELSVIGDYYARVRIKMLSATLMVP